MADHAGAQHRARHPALVETWACHATVVEPRACHTTVVKPGAAAQPRTPGPAAHAGAAAMRVRACRVPPWAADLAGEVALERLEALGQAHAAGPAGLAAARAALLGGRVLWGVAGGGLCCVHQRGGGLGAALWCQALRGGHARAVD